MLNANADDLDEEDGVKEPLFLKQKNGLWRPDKHKSNHLLKRGYQLGEVISRGEKSVIRSAEKLIPGKGIVRFAVKTFKKSQIHSLLALTEVRCLRKIQHHQLVVTMYDAIETPNAIYLVLERASNGNLLSYVNRLGFLPLIESHRLFQQLLEVISFCHKLRICHRDIKLDNILLDLEKNIKLCDFDLSAVGVRISALCSPNGSLGYVAPEILTDSAYSGYKADIWSAGVCLYAMLCGRLPFAHLEERDIYLEAVKNKIIFTQPLNTELQILIQAMLNVVPKYRPSIRSLRNWGWGSGPIPPENYIWSSVSKICGLDLNAEHGFAMDQNTNSNFHSNLVSRFLKLAKRRDRTEGKKQYQNEEFNYNRSSSALFLKQLQSSFNQETENELNNLGCSLSGEVLHHLVWTKGKLKKTSLIEGKTKKERLQQWRNWCNRIVPLE